MVHQIGGGNNDAYPLQDARSLQTNKALGAAEVGAGKVSEATKEFLFGLDDNAAISDEARAKFESERSVLKFTRQVQGMDDPSPNPRVAELKNLVNQGRIHEYLSSVDTSSLVDSLLSSPTAAFLK